MRRLTPVHKLKSEIESFLRMVQHEGKDWFTETTIWSCPKGYSKIYLRRKKGRSGRSPILTECLPSEEAKQQVKQINEQLKKFKP